MKGETRLTVNRGTKLEIKSTVVSFGKRIMSGSSMASALSQILLCILIIYKLGIQQGDRETRSFWDCHQNGADTSYKTVTFFIEFRTAAT